MNMKKHTIAVLTIAALLVLTSWAVYADRTENVKDWWSEMREHHQATHGDDFDTHHQNMHGEDWQEHIQDCHDDAENENYMMGSNERASMM